MFEIELFICIEMDLVLIAYNGWCAIKPNQTTNSLYWVIYHQEYLCDTKIFQINLLDTYISIIAQRIDLEVIAIDEYSILLRSKL